MSVTATEYEIQNRNGEPRAVEVRSLNELFADDETAERWWVASRWPNGVAFPEWRQREHLAPQDMEAAALLLPRLPQGLLGEDGLGLQATRWCNRPTARDRSVRR